MPIVYAREQSLSLDDFLAILDASGLAERRPVDDRVRLQKMLDHADLTVTARTEAGAIVGVARCVTDFAYCLFCSDLAVDKAFQGQGIAKQLLALVCELTPQVKAHLLTSAPGAVSFYEHVGYQRMPNAFYFDRFAEP
jgi:GNAT superfamily N-acetyltransferase